MGSGILYGCPDAGVYYTPGTTGWDNPPYGITPVAWNGDLATGPGAYGPAPDGFLLTTTGHTNIPVAIQACTNLAAQTWTTIQTCRLTNGSVTLKDPNWAAHPQRFYRVSWP
jgi:hypothetical protein